MKFLWLICLLVCGAWAEEETSAENDVEGYYWRNYTGDIPSDALPAGVDASNNTIYIGQAIYPPYNISVPGHINVTDNNIYYEHSDYEHAETENVTILCTENPDAFQWVRAEVHDAISDVLPANMSFVIGGYDSSYPVAVAREPIDGEMRIGKTVLIHGVFDGMYISAGGVGRRLDSVEVLVYNSSAFTN